MNLDYFNTFIAVAEDCKAKTGLKPKPRGDKPTVAEVQYRMLVEEPYQHSQPDILFTSSSAMRENPSLGKDARDEFFSKSQACLRASPMGKTHGWGIHFDDKGRAAAYGVGTPEYDKFASDASLTQTRAMRSKRA